jgi:ZIP family zinc transporter
MLYVSFVEIFAKGTDALVMRYGDYWGHWINAASFFGGILLIGLIDNLIPAAENPHEIHPKAELNQLKDPAVRMAEHPAEHTGNAENEGKTSADREEEKMHQTAHHHTLHRMGLFTALAIAIHNFPEGLATFLAALQDPGVGAAIAIAVALHNIPEGISVSVPIYYATGNRAKAFWYSVLSGLAEPVGAVAAYVGIRFFMGSDSGVIPPQVMGILFGGVAGIMVYISLDELLPASRAYGKGHDSLFGLIAGMLVMALSLLLMR